MDELAAVAAVRSGDVERLAELVADDPDLAGSRPIGYGGRTLLHIATDWPGHLPRVGETVAVLAAAGADVDAAMQGRHGETPLHWASSSDDVAALDALLDAGADIDVLGAVIGGGTPLNDATAFAQWHAARRLVERGARVSPFDAAALGLTDELRRLLVVHPDESLDALLWGACHGGHRETAELLVGLGADPTWVGWDELTPVGAAERAGAVDLAAWLQGRPRP